LQNIDEKQLRETAQVLASVDNRINAGAILGFTKGTRCSELVGVARLARLPNQGERSIAEVAVVVRDDYHRQGIGTELLRLLLILARWMGIEVLTATVQSDNLAIAGILNKLNLPVSMHTSRGETEMWIDI
jgi:acetyltransferase